MTSEKMDFKAVYFKINALEPICYEVDKNTCYRLKRK